MAATPAKVVSLHVRPLQVAHLCFEVDGILGPWSSQLANGQLGQNVTAFDFPSFYAELGEVPTVTGEPSRLLYDYLAIEYATPVVASALTSLRAESRKAALDKAVNARQNAYFTKYSNIPGIIKLMELYYTYDTTNPLSATAKPNYLAVLAGISKDQWIQLLDAYESETPPRTGVVKNTISALGSDTTSYGYSAAGGETAQVSSGTSLPFQPAQMPPQPPAPWAEPSSWPPPAPKPPPPVGSSDEWSNFSWLESQTLEITAQQATSYQTVSSADKAHQDQKIVNTDYGYRVPKLEASAQYYRAQISLMDQLFAAYMQSLNLTNPVQMFQNELNSIDGDVYRLQIAYLNTILMSPISGVVTGVYKQPGEAVRAGETVIRVENNETVLLVATLVYRGPITLSSNVKVTANLFSSASPITLPAGSVVAVRGLQADDHWEVIIQCPNHQPGSTDPILPLGYHFDYDNTTVSIS
ncbi:hypothetical protein [Paraburkholderia sp.]|uniref:hypothetical protein n=1 Tax=Paraburkholderia sp. TaxID=1926495 RepID=UPI003C7D1DEA